MMMVHRRPEELRFDRTERMVLVVVALVVAALLGIYATLFLFHSQTSAEVRAANCVTAKCESPAIKAIISQAAAQIGTLLTTEDAPNHALLCISLSELNVPAQSSSASRALAKYCPKGATIP